MVIEVKNICKSFKNNQVLNNVNMHLESGHIYGLYGRNGSGKSVFLKILCNLYAPSRGEVLIDGVNYNNQNNCYESMGVLIENPSFFPDLTGFENLKMLAKIKNKITDEDINKMLELVNLRDEKDKKYSKYSLGMKQKLGIVQAIMENQDIVILDEPFNGIEEKTVNKLIEYLKKYKEKDKIIIISSHIKEDLKSLSDKIYFFDNGNVDEKKID